MGHNSRTFSKDHKNAKSSKEGTKKNIKTSLNKLQTRNETLFGPRGRNLYNPNSRFDYGGAYDMYPFGGVNTKTHTHFDEGGPNSNPTTPAPASAAPATMSYDDYVNKYYENYERLKAEQDRVNNVRGNIIPTAQKFAASPSPQNFLRGAGTTGNFCNAYTQQCYSNAGLTTTKDLTVNGKFYPAGSAMPMIPGNQQHEGVINEEGFIEVPLNEAQPGDNIKKQYYAPSLPWQGPAKEGAKPRWISGHSMIYAGKEGDKFKVYNSPGSRTEYNDRMFNPNDWVGNVSNPQYTGNPTGTHRMKAFRYVGNIPQYEQELNQINQQLQSMPVPAMQPIPQQLITQSPDEREIIIPQQSTMANLSSRKKGGSLSGAPYDGQPTAKTFFGQTWIPPGPVGFYKLGGQNTDGIAFPQQVPDNYFFAGVPWQNSLGHFAYGGGLPGGANQGMPCLECGGYMEMGGDTQFGGGVDGSMDYFKEGGHWIQEAKSSMRNNLRAIAKKKYGGIDDTALDPQGDYIGNMKNGFKNSIALNFGLATADDIAKNYDAMGQNASMGNTPMAKYGYDMNYDPYAGYNRDAINNYGMAQGMLDNANAKTKANNMSFFQGASALINEGFDPNNKSVKWKMKKSSGAPDLTDIQTTNYGNMQTSAYGGELYKAAFGVDAFGNPSPNQMGPLSQAETNQRTIDNAKNLPWNRGNQMMGPGPQGPPQFQGIMHPDLARQQGPGLNNPQGGFYPNVYPRVWQNDPGFDPRYREQNPNYWTSQNGQTRYDYGNPNAWDNLNRYPGGRGGSWNTPGWNTPNPFANAMFNNPNFYTGISGLDVKRGLFGSMANPKRVKMKFNTYVNPRTGKTEMVPAGPQQGPQGPMQGPTNKPGDKSKPESTERPADQPLTNPQAFNPGFPVYNSNNPLKAVPMPAESTQRPGDQAIQNNPAFNPGFPTYNSANPLKSVPYPMGPQGAGLGNTPMTMDPNQMRNMPIVSQQSPSANQLLPGSNPAASSKAPVSSGNVQASNPVNSPVTMDPRQMQNMPMTSNYPLPQGQVLLPPGSSSNYDFMSSAQNPSAGPVNTPAQATSQLPAVPPRISGDYDFMSDLQNNQRPGPVMQQAYGGMPDYNYAYGGMPDYSYAYGGYLPMAAFGYNVYGQKDPNFMGPLSPQYEQTLMGAQPAYQADEAEFAEEGDPTGSYELTGKKKTNIDGTTIGMGTRGVLGLAKNMFSTDKPYLQEFMAQNTTSDRLNSETQGYKGNEPISGMGTGIQFGANSNISTSKSGGMIYANGGAYQTGVPMDLTDDEIQAIYAAGGTVSYV